jgi:hypothetical protein
LVSTIKAPSRSISAGKWGLRLSNTNASSDPGRRLLPGSNPDGERFSPLTPEHPPPKQIGRSPLELFDKIPPGHLSQQRSLVTPKEVLDMGLAGATIPIAAPPYPHSLNSIKKTTNQSF